MMTSSTGIFQNLMFFINILIWPGDDGSRWCQAWKIAQCWRRKSTMHHTNRSSVTPCLPHWQLLSTSAIYNDADGALVDYVHAAAFPTYPHTLFLNSQADLYLNYSSAHYDEDADKPASRSSPCGFPAITNANRKIAVNNQQGAKLSNDPLPVDPDNWVSTHVQRVGTCLDVRAVDFSDMDVQKTSNNTLSK